MKHVLLGFSIVTMIVFISGWLSHDFNGSCLPYAYPPALNMMKLINFLFTIMCIVLYCMTVKKKKDETKEDHKNESEEVQEYRDVFEGMFA